MSNDVKAAVSSNGCSQGNISCERSSLQLDSRKHFGTWIIVVFCELLCWHYNVDKDPYRPYTPSDSLAAAGDCAQLWLRSALKYIAADDIGGRTYIWAMLLQMIASEQRLSQSDLVLMKDDLGDSNDMDAHCFSAVNSATRAVLRSNPSSQVLDEIGLFVSYYARTDVELGVR
ncbi:hypothetical protein J3B02_004191 [Coemansia erecta]|nr:hypothetical protein J3B02_004191 [Coemansia erecta]